VKKEILASLTSSHLWRQVVSSNSWHQDVLSIKKVASRCLVSSRPHQDVAYAKLHPIKPIKFNGLVIYSILWESRMYICLRNKLILGNQYNSLMHKHFLKFLQY